MQQPILESQGEFRFCWGIYPPALLQFFLFFFFSTVSYPHTTSPVSSHAISGSAHCLLPPCVDEQLRLQQLLPGLPGAVLPGGWRRLSRPSPPLWMWEQGRERGTRRGTERPGHGAGQRQRQPDTAGSVTAQGSVFTLSAPPPSCVPLSRQAMRISTPRRMFV